MGDIAIHSDRLSLEIDPVRGGSILSLRLRTRAGLIIPMISRDMTGEDPHAKPPCFVMAPWTNRIAAAAFTFDGVRHQLKPSSADGSAIHGDVRSRPFAILDRSPVSARLAFDSRSVASGSVNFPWPFVCEVRYEIDDATLIVDVLVTNVSAQPFPAGAGIHPYFPRHLRPLNEPARPAVARRVVVAVRSCERYPATRMIPSGPARADAITRSLSGGRLPGTPLDDVFRWRSRHAAIRWTTRAAGDIGLEMRASESLGHLVVFTPAGADGCEAPFFAVEPVSMVNDGFNLHAAGERETGVAVLAPGATLGTRTTIRCVEFDAGERFEHAAGIESAPTGANT